jgi:hypothetical protein
MITVEDVIKKSNQNGSPTEIKDEKLPGEVKSLKQTYWPWILLALVGIGGAIWWFRRGKNNGEIPG